MPGIDVTQLSYTILGVVAIVTIYFSIRKYTKDMNGKLVGLSDAEHQQIKSIYAKIDAEAVAAGSATA